LKKDKKAHSKICVPSDKIEVVPNTSNLAIEIKKRDQKLEDKLDHQLAKHSQIETTSSIVSKPALQRQINCPAQLSTLS
jgi:hypothetical protein